MNTDSRVQTDYCIQSRAIFISPFFHDITHGTAMTAADYNMTVWILAGNYISFTIAAGLIRLHMPGVKKSHV